jgi:hypothetical protein
MGMSARSGISGATTDIATTFSRLGSFSSMSHTGVAE